MGIQILRDWELAFQLESAFNTSPGALAAGDFMKHTSTLGFDKVVERYDRENDRDVNQASVITTHLGRESSKWKLECDLTPSNNSGTPTEPDIDPVLEAHFGQKHKATAHTTTGTGSTGVTLELASGGGAASGIAVGDIIAVNVSTAFGYECRQVTGISTDTVTVDRAFSADPASGRAVKVGTTYRLLFSALKSLHLWQFLAGNNFRHKAGGCVPQNCAIDVDFASKAPVCKVKFDGIGAQKVTHSTSRPTPTTVGVPLIPTEGKVWMGATLGTLLKYGLQSNNGNTLRQSESASLYPTAVKKTDNMSRYKISQSIDFLLNTGTNDGFFDNAAALTAYDVIVQLGVTVGQIVAIRTPKWIPDAIENEQDGEVGLGLSGRLYGTSGDDEISIAFI
jgi:hypothetical protein